MGQSRPTDIKYRVSVMSEYADRSMKKAPGKESVQTNFLNLKRMMGTDRKGPQLSPIQLAMVPARFVVRTAIILAITFVIFFFLLRVLEVVFGTFSIAYLIEEPGMQSSLEIPEGADPSAVIPAAANSSENGSIFPVSRHGFKILADTRYSLIQEVDQATLLKMGIRTNPAFEFAYISYIDQTFWQLPRVSVLVKYATHVDEFTMFKLRNDTSIFATLGQYQRQMLSLSFSKDMSQIYALSIDKKFIGASDFSVHIDGLFFRRGINFTHTLSFDCMQSVPFPGPAGLALAADNTFAYNLGVTGLCDRAYVSDGWRNFSWSFWENENVNLENLRRDPAGILLITQHKFKGAISIHFRSGGLIEEIKSNSLSHIPGKPKPPEPRN